MTPVQPYHPKNKVRLVTAASLFDGHDAAINIMRRIMQSSGAEIIHLGHNRSVQEIVDCAIQEDVQGIAITSYQGGHTEFFKYMYDLLKERGASHIKIFGGGGGTILPSEIEDLHKYGITRIYHPDDGRAMGLQGMINDVLKQCDFPIGFSVNGELKNFVSYLKDDKKGGSPVVKDVARLISIAENNPELYEKEIKVTLDKNHKSDPPVLGITGTGGSGKSSMVDELVRRFILDFPDKTVAIVSVDPSKRKTGGALLGDRIRMNAINNPRVYMRSLATRQSNLALSKYVHATVDILKAAHYDLVILETSGIGQSDTEIVDHSDVSLYVMTPEFGAATQLEKIDMLDFADVIAINKFDKRGALDALRDVRKQVQRNRNLWEQSVDDMPVFGCIASQFNDPGVNHLYHRIMELLSERNKGFTVAEMPDGKQSEKIYIIPPNRTRYLSEISENNRKYDEWVDKQVSIARRLFAYQTTMDSLDPKKDESMHKHLEVLISELKKDLDGECLRILEGWEEKKKRYAADEYIYLVRGREIKVNTKSESLSHLKIPKVALPKWADWGEILRWCLQENVPGEFPYTAGVFPFKREGEDPTRMFAGEGAPERTNRRFHYVSLGMPANRLSTAFDSVTLYGEDPDLRPDIYGKIGNSGVSICCLDDAKKLYSGFDLCNPKTSVSMTINGPAATIAAFFMNAAIDQQCEKYIRENKLEHLVEARLKEKYDDRGFTRPQYNSGENGESKLPEGNNGLGLLLLGITGDEVLPAEEYEKIKSFALSSVRGTVQADILKEDQAQNTCIFSTEFSLRVMGDVQDYFIQNKVRNFYSVSISGYHIAEAGANPISQLAFTLSNGFTFVEYYRSRGMNVDDFAPNLSFFFSNGVDPEYAVIGRVARRIWAKAMKNLYGANERSQMLKYHIQTSGRSLHAQEIAFNDIRTTLQALYAIYDNCNSLHTNAYDEAITTPTEESVRRAMAIQLIINKELGLAKNENPLQGAFIIEELTDLVEEAVLMEFDRITERGGVLGAMETMYQRGKIQEESLYYETMKHTGELPLIGVNTFLSKEGSPTILPREVIRAEEWEKQYQIETLNNLHKSNELQANAALRKLQKTAVENGNIFEELMRVVKVCSLGQVTGALFEVGGQYRRNM
ncbi:MAG: methylmalonyl-CoA mutase family protein [Lewinellaceae bacterium]|nr:methylmalonyl-CoA mutase family protein [Saprospiraceae bacterium]MCB9342779.1 methylmalonyl-CoA mutase family protein [Lewinellaceae bacterium]